MSKIVSEVAALDGYRISVSFNDGVSGIIELSDLVQKGIFRVLNDETLFRKVYINRSAIAWSEELEIDADNIYAELLDKEPVNLFHTSIHHATDQLFPRDIH